VARADLLQEAGDLRGELMRLHLDQERGGARGLAKGRLERLEEEARAVVRTLGAEGYINFKRGLVNQCEIALERAKSPEDWWWAGVAKCRFNLPKGGFDRRLWMKTPLAGPRLGRVEQLECVEREGLALLAGGIDRPRLRHLEFSEGYRPALLAPADVRYLWRNLGQKAPALMRVVVHFTSSTGRDPERMLAMVEAITRLPLRELTLELTGAEVVAANDLLLRMPGGTANVTAALLGMGHDDRYDSGGELVNATVRLDGARLEVSVNPEYQERAARVLGLPLDSPRLVFT
jgi:hypothetical protein